MTDKYFADQYPFQINVAWPKNSQIQVSILHHIRKFKKKKKGRIILRRNLVKLVSIHESDFKEPKCFKKILLIRPKFNEIVLSSSRKYQKGYTRSSPKEIINQKEMYRTIYKGPEAAIPRCSAA